MDRNREARREFDKEREKGVAIWEKRNREEKH